MHNRIDVQQRVTKALDEVIAKRRIRTVIVSLVAQKVQISKGLIYRHFKSVQALLEHHVRKSGQFSHFTLNYLEHLFTSLPGVWSGQMMQFFRQLRASKASRKVLQANWFRGESLDQAIQQNRHQEIISLGQRLHLLDNDESSSTLTIDLHSEAGWQRMQGALKRLHGKFHKPAHLTRQPQGIRRVLVW